MSAFPNSRNLLFVAVAFASSIQAQPAVTFYGELDLGYKHTASGATKTSGIDSIYSPRLGWRGEELLSNGLKVAFTLEYALNIDINSGVGIGPGTAARDTSLALAGNFGTLSIGRMPTPGHRATIRYDAIAAQFSPLETLTNGNGTNYTTTIDPISRFDNFVTYATPNWNGLSATVGHSFGGFSSNDTTSYRGTQERASVFSLEYVQGPLSAIYVRHHLTDIGAPAITVKADQTENFLGGIYDLGPFKLYASAQDVRQLGGPRDRVWAFGGRVPLANDELRLGYAKFLNGNPVGAVGGGNDSASWALAYIHSLSKRSRLYLGYQRLELDAGIEAPNRAWVFSRVNPGTSAANGDSAGYVIGFGHRF